MMVYGFENFKEYLLVILIVNLILAILPATIAKKKGRDFGNWYLYGVLFWFIAVLHAIMLPEPSERKSDLNLSLTSVGDKSQHKLKNKYDLNSPIDIIDYDIVKDAYDNIYLNLTLRNLNYGTLTAVKFDIMGYNAFDEPIYMDSNNTFKILLQDINIPPQQIFKNEHPIPLTHKEIRKIDISVNQALYTDGKKVNIDEHEIIEKNIDYITERPLLSIARTILNTAVCYPAQHMNYWICACGHANKDTISKCLFCNTEKNDVFQNFSKDQLVIRVGQIASENLRLEREQEEIEKTKQIKYKKRLILAIGCGLCCTILIIALILRWDIIDSNIKVVQIHKYITTYFETNHISNGTYYFSSKGKEAASTEHDYTYFYNIIINYPNFDSFSDEKKLIILKNLNSDADFITDKSYIIFRIRSGNKIYNISSSNLVEQDITH